MCFYQRIRFLLLSVGWTNRNKFVLSLFGFGFSFFTFANISRPKVQSSWQSSLDLFNISIPYSEYQALCEEFTFFVRN